MIMCHLCYIDKIDCARACGSHWFKIDENAVSCTRSRNLTEESHTATYGFSGRKAYKKGDEFVEEWTIKHKFDTHQSTPPNMLCSFHLRQNANEEEVKSPVKTEVPDSITD